MTNGPDHLTLYSTLLISVLVLVAYGGVVVLLFFHELPASSKEISLLVLGALNTMAGTVVAYWLGSTTGSQKKDSTISQLAGKPQEDTHA